MAAYLIAEVDVHDSVGYEEYRQKVPAIINAYGGRYLVRGGALDVLEGDRTPKRMVVLEFRDRAALQAFWNSPEYLPLRALRERAARASIVAVEGMAAPAL